MYSSEKTDSQKVSPAPAAGIPVNSANTKAPIPWFSGLFDCFVDLRSCLITYWCPCITFGQISEVVDQGPHSCVTNGGIYALILLFTRCQCFFSSLYRTKMRQQYNLEEGPMGDFLVHCLCDSCAICQEYRELESRGHNMNIGVQDIVNKINSALAKPPTQQGMTR